jgi:N-methylhydantoinase A
VVPKTSTNPVSGSSSSVREAGHRPMYLSGQWQDVLVMSRAELRPGKRLDGPAVVEFAEATCLLRPGWSGRIDAVGSLLLEREREL